MNVFLGIDSGSVTTKLAALDEAGEVVASLYLRNQGRPVAAIQLGLKQMEGLLLPGTRISGVAATGSARYLTGAVVGADLVKNEITSHAVGALRHVPDAKTVIEIGGQDSKIIILSDGMVMDFGMNTVCAAGTGSFLDHQAQRLDMSIEELSERSLRSKTPANIVGRCTVFAESDMVHKQQAGRSIEDILHGLCLSLARNYLHNVGPCKEILPPVVFQGGVAFNKGMVRAFQEILGIQVIVPLHHEVMGAVGAGLVALEEMGSEEKQTSDFKGFAVGDAGFQTSSFECAACSSICEIAQLSSEGRVVANWGGRCDLWGQATQEEVAKTRGVDAVIPVLPGAIDEDRR